MIAARRGAVWSKARREHDSLTPSLSWVVLAESYSQPCLFGCSRSPLSWLLSRRDTHISELMISSTDGFASVPPRASKSQCIIFLYPISRLLDHHFVTTNTVKGSLMVGILTSAHTCSLAFYKPFSHSFRKLLIFIYEYVFAIVCSHGPGEARRSRIPQEWSYKQFWAIMWVLETEPSSSGRTLSDFLTRNHPLLSHVLMCTTLKVQSQEHWLEDSWNKNTGGLFPFSPVLLVNI